MIKIVRKEVFMSNRWRDFSLIDRIEEAKKQFGFVGTSSYTKTVNYEIFQVVRSHFLKIYTNKVSIPDNEENSFEVEEVFSFIHPGIFTFPTVVGFDPLENFISYDNAMLAIVIYKGQRYLLSVTTLDDRLGTSYVIIVSGGDFEEFYAVELVDLIIKQSLKNSGYFGKFLRIFSVDGKVRFKVLPTPTITLKDIYLKDKSDLEDFVEAVRRNDNGFRYLFVGEPGTGKTDTIKATIAECLKSKRITVIEVDEGCEVPLETVFEYANIFSPSLLCIDDLDLLTGARGIAVNSSNLSSGLQALDGFVEHDDHYLIATTNDRDLVDIALRRPGRFDLIIEFKELDQDFYSSLVFRESNDERLSNLFNDEQIKKKLGNLKATGAFMVTLVKHLLQPRYETARYDVGTILKVIDKLQRSFKHEIKNEEKLGF
jgi:cell division protease FtsH